MEIFPVIAKKGKISCRVALFLAYLGEDMYWKASEVENRKPIGFPEE